MKPQEIREMLDEEDIGLFDEIERKVVPAGKERHMFEDCIAKIRRRKCCIARRRS